MGDKEAFKQMMGNYVPPVKKVRPQYNFGSLWVNDVPLTTVFDSIEDDDLDLIRSLLA